MKIEYITKGIQHQNDTGSHDLLSDDIVMHAEDVSDEIRIEDMKV